MKGTLSLVAGALLFLAAPALADMPMMHGKNYDVCIDLAHDTRANTEGNAFAVAAPIFTGGTIPAGGVSSCGSITAAPIGTFFAMGRVVAGLGAAAADDVFYVDWHFRINGKGAFDTSGIVKAAATYPQTIVGSTSVFVSPPSGTATITVLHSDSATSQFRTTVPPGFGLMGMGMNGMH